MSIISSFLEFFQDFQILAGKQRTKPISFNTLKLLGSFDTYIIPVSAQLKLEQKFDQKSQCAETPQETVFIKLLSLSCRRNLFPQKCSTHSQNQNRPKSQNTSPNFGYVVLNCQRKVQRLEKKILYDVLFCKSRLSKMTSTETNKIKKRTAL